MPQDLWGCFCTLWGSYSSLKLFRSVATVYFTEFMRCVQNASDQASLQQGRILQNLSTLRQVTVIKGDSVAEWLACWTQAQNGLGSNRSHDAVGYQS